MKKVLQYRKSPFNTPDGLVYLHVTAKMRCSTVGIDDAPNNSRCPFLPPAPGFFIKTSLILAQKASLFQ